MSIDPFPAAASRGSAVLKALGLGLLLGLLARAIIVQAGADPAAVRARAAAAREAGAKFRGPVRIHFADAEGGNAMQHGSGTYLGASADGRTGYILTAAHIFQFNPDEGTAAAFCRAMAWAGAEAPSGEGAVIDRIFVHPDYAGRAQAGKAWDRSFPNDIAVMSFSWDGRDRLKATGLWQAATLVDGKEATDLLVADAEVAGYGLFGTNGTGEPELSDGIQAGWTRVQQASRLGRPMLVNWVPCAVSQERYLETKPPIKRLLHRFQPDRRVRAARLPWEKQAGHTIQAHPEQVLPAPGDSGGPLFLWTGRGLQVLGITSCLLLNTLVLEGSGTPELCLGSVWEPVAPHRDWIRLVRETGEAPAWVLRPGQPHWERQGPAKGPEGKGAEPADGECRWACAIL